MVEQTTSDAESGQSGAGWLSQWMSLHNGTALSGAGTDYGPQSDGELCRYCQREPDSDHHAERRCQIAEGNEEFYVRMSNRSTSLPVSISDNGTVTITDDDTAMVTISDNSSLESSGMDGDPEPGQGSSRWLHGGSLYRQRDSWRVIVTTQAQWSDDLQGNAQERPRK